MSYNLARFELSNIVEEGAEDYYHSIFTISADLLGKSEDGVNMDDCTYSDGDGGYWVDHHYLFGLKFKAWRNPNHWSVYFRVALFGKYFSYDYSTFKEYKYEAL